MKRLGFTKKDLDDIDAELEQPVWKIKYHPDAEKDLKKLDDSVKKIVLKGIIKVSENPLPKNEGGYGKPLGNKNKII